MSELRIGIIMNGVSGRMGYRQHLVRSILAIREQGGIELPDGSKVTVKPLLVGRSNANPQVFTYGHRNLTDFAWHPTTGELWATEIGPMGGDEINILRPGQNYGWPFVSLGKLYNKKDISQQHWYREGMEMPFMHWTPSISPSTLERLPAGVREAQWSAMPAKPRPSCSAGMFEASSESQARWIAISFFVSAEAIFASAASQRSVAPATHSGSRFPGSSSSNGR